MPALTKLRPAGSGTVRSRARTVTLTPAQRRLLARIADGTTTVRDARRVARLMRRVARCERRR